MPPLLTHILPLIETSGYNNMRDAVGGSPTPIDVGAFGEDTVIRVVARVNHQGIEFGQFRDMAGAMIGAAATEWVGDWVTLWFEDSVSLRSLVGEALDQESDFTGEEFFDLSIVAGAHVTNKLSLAAFLVGIKNTVDVAAPNTVIFTPLEPYEDVTIVRISPDPRADLGEALGVGDAENPGDGPAIYYATIGDAFFVSLQLRSLQTLIDRLGADQSNEEIVEANMLLYASPEATTAEGESWRDVVSPVLEQRARDASRRGLALVWLLDRCGALEGTSVQDAARRRLGYRLVCPDGGEYVQTEGELHCSVHGSLEQPRQFESLPDESPLSALLGSIRTIVTDLRFTDDGIETGVKIDR